MRAAGDWPSPLEGAADRVTPSEAAATGDVVRAGAVTARRRSRRAAGEGGHLGQKAVAEFNAMVARLASQPVPRSDAEAAERLKIERAATCYKDLAPPPNYEKARLGEPPLPKWRGTPAQREQRKTLSDKLAAFANNYGIVALLGGRGVAKTRFAWATLIEACKFGRSAKYVKASDLFIDIYDTFGRAQKTVRSVLEGYVKPQILAIDELSEMQAEKDSQTTRLTYVIDRRYDANLATILLSNDDLATFQRNIGDSVLSRLGERGRIYVLDWPSFREQSE